jgi:ubiquinone/menaquinone biosynthesis C-methylase UbiE
MDTNNLKKAKMFNKKASKNKSKPNKIIEILELSKGNKIADIGSGGGYFTIRFAKKVTEEGHVYAIDINSEFLRYIEQKANKNDLRNITTIHTKNETTQLPKEKLNYIFLRNVYHHIPNRIKYLQKLGLGLDKNGKIIIIEHNGSGFLNFNKLFGHYVNPEIIKNEMKKAGYIIDNEYFFIRHQSFTIFKRRQK